MAFTLAQHVRFSRESRAIRRTIHLGILVVPGTPMPGVNRPSERPPVGRTVLDDAVRVIRRELTQVYRSFEVTDRRWRVSYEFVFDLAQTPSTVPVHSDTIYPAAPGRVRDGSLRTGGAALREARTLRMENIAIIVDLVRGNPHGPLLDEAGMSQDTGGSRAGLQAQCSNAMVLGAEQHLAGGLTPAHEAGHMLGLANADDGSRIMGPHSLNRSLTLRDQQLVHQAIEADLPGIRRPLNYQTAGSQPPYEFPGQLPALR